MGKQLEKGTQFPMRPACALIRTNVALTVPNDPAPVDWTAAGTKVLLGSGFSAHLMDDDGYISIDEANEEVDLKPAIYRLSMKLRLDNVDAANAADARIAITNGAGSAVYKESVDQEIMAGGDGTVNLVHYLHLQALTAVSFRVAQTSGSGTDLRTIATDIFLEITKVGNVNET